MHTTNTSGFSSGASIPDASIFSSKLSDHTSTEGKSAKKQPSGPDNNSSKRGFPFWLLLFLLLLFTTGVSARSQKLLNAAQILTPGIGINEIASSGTSGINGVDGINGEKGANGNDGRPGTNGEKGQDGSTGSAGVAGANGSAGADGAQGVPGSNDCISGICVSRQTTSPGTQETGNINIDGTILAANLSTSGNASIEGNTTLGNASGDGLTVNAASWTLANATTVNIANSSTSALNFESGLLNLDTSNSRIGINDTTPSNTLTVNGTLDVQGHSAFGSGSTVNGATFLSDAFGVSQHNALISNYETLTTLNSATTVYEGLVNAITLNPSSAPSYNQVSGLNGVVQVASGNAQDFSNQLVGGALAVQHGGTGDITSAIGAQGAILKMSTGDIATASVIKSSLVNASPSGEITTANGLEAGISFNAGTIGTYNGVNITANSANVTTNRGLYVQSATGTKTNNYGLYVDDQSGAGSSNSYNVYSAGATAKNYFAGLVSVGSTGTPGTVEQFRVGTPTTVDNLANAIISTSATTSKGLVIQGKASQTANLQEWQDSSGNVIAAISAAGRFATNDPTPNAWIEAEATSGVQLRITYDDNATTSFTMDSGGGLTLFSEISNNSTANAFKLRTYSSQLSSVLNVTNEYNTDKTSGTFDGINETLGFAPTSGTAVFNGINLVQTINQTGGANGITRGLYVNPTLTAAADYRGVEVANNSGFGVYQSGASASNYFAGKLGVGTSTPGTNNSKLEVNGSAYISDYVYTSMLRSSSEINSKIDLYDSSNGVGFILQNNTKDFRWAVNSGSDLMLIDGATGHVGIGDITPDARLDVSDTGTAGSVFQTQNSAGTCDHTPGAGSETVSCSSDERLKSNITDAASVLSEINGLKIHDYTVIASGQQTTGLIAQEAINTHPEMVHMGEDGYYKVDSYNPWKVLKGIQELSSSQDNLLMQLTNAIDKTSGDIDETNELLANQGLRIDQLSATLDAYASQLSDHQTRIEALEEEIRALKQN